MVKRVMVRIDEGGNAPNNLAVLFGQKKLPIEICGSGVFGGVKLLLAFNPQRGAPRRITPVKLVRQIQKLFDLRGTIRPFDIYLCRQKTPEACVNRERNLC